MKLLAGLLMLLCAGSAAADCAAPADWARTFYSKHYLFYSGDPAPVLKLTTAGFGAYLKKEWEWTKGEVGSFDYDPWLGAQDGKIGKPVRFSIEKETPDAADVLMSYPFVLEPKRPSKPHTVHLALRKSAHGCWQLNDFVTPLGESLSQLYSAGQPQQ